MEESQSIKRSWDTELGGPILKLSPGEYYVTQDTQDVISTILGSCISACIRDPYAQVGGMNHFMLPIQGKLSSQMALTNSEATRYGNWAMEYLINQILKLGGQRERLEVKIFGGSNLLSQNTTNVGQMNIEFVEQYLQAEKMHITSQDVGGTMGRKIFYYPITGQAYVKKFEVTQLEDLLQTEKNYMQQLISQPLVGEIELFGGKHDKKD